MLPPRALDTIYLAFSAKYLTALVRILKTLSRETQPKAYSTLIQIFALLPEPKANPYVRQVLRSERAAGLPNLVVQAYLAGVELRRPAGPGHFCTLMINLFFWCDVEMGDDQRASVDKDARAALVTRLQAFQGTNEYAALDRYQSIEVDRLMGMLGAVENMPTGPMPVGYYLISTRQHLEGSVTGQRECDVCVDEDAGLLCSKCKSVRYCGKECQARAWKDGHKYKCFALVD